FPPPSHILDRLWVLLRTDDTFLRGVLQSHLRLAMGALLAVPLAVFLGLELGLHPVAARLLNPLIAVTYPIPKLAVFPLLMVVFGIGESSKVAIIAIGIFFLVLLSTLQGCRRLFKEDYMDIVTVFRIPPGKRFFSIALRGSLPDILSGLKMGLGYGLVMVVASEFTFSEDGIGFFIWRAWDQFRVVDIYCGLTVLSLSGFLIFAAVDQGTKRLKWYDQDA
ncbi:MAG TPA: ABC transporter permease subunit, partial [Elusimicrobiota bacterium]|nr:ABC transporter permease subunit [Elusimicrobiota bacterium]